MAQAKKGMGLTSQIFIGLILGVIFGHIFPQWGIALKPIGDVFIRMIKMIVVPLIFSSLVMGVAGTGDFKKMGRLGVKSIIWFEIATTLALIVGLIIVNVVQPGVGINVAVSDTGAVVAASKKTIDLLQMVVNIVPTNIVEAMGKGNMLQIVFFSIFFGVAAAAIGPKGQPVVKLAKSVAEIMFKFTWYVMKLAPLGVFALISFTVGKYGIAMLIPLAKLLFAQYFALVLFIIVGLMGVSLIIRVNFWQIMRALKEPILIAFSTTSSEAALPLAMEKLEMFGVPEHIITFVLPTGFAFNMEGSSVYCGMAVVFIAQVYNIDFPVATQIIMMLTLMVATKGLSAVPSASMVIIAGTAVAFGLPVEGMGLILGIDRILDMGRTAVNLMGNCIAAIVVARWEHELPDEVLQEAYVKSYND